MEKNEIIEKVKELLFSKPEVKEEVENKFIDAELENGTKIKVDGELAPEAPVFVLDEEGNETPAPDGEHKLSDGTIVKTEGGVIVEVMPAEVVEVVEDLVEKKEEKMEDEKPVEVEVEMTEIEMVKERLTALEKKIEEMISDKEVVSEDMKSVKEATVYLAEEFSKTPAGEKIEIKKSGFISNLTDSKRNNKEEKLNKIKEILRG